MSLGDTVDNLAVLDEALDHPVVLASARDALIHASLAQIVVTIVADIAVVMHVGNGHVAAVAVHRVVVHV